jgi:hypothetical protein
MYIAYITLVGLKWVFSHALLHASYIVGWMPHYLYYRSIGKRVHRIYLMRGGKYCRIVLQDGWGVRFEINS